MDKISELLGVEIPEGTSEEEKENLILEKIKEKDTRITTLESENSALSADKEALNSTVEGLNTEKENLSKELTDTKTKLSNTEGKLEQVTTMYKEQFTQDPNEQDSKPKDDKSFGDDVLQQILDTK